MANHTNFYETIKEARMRLQSTVVLYDGEPYYVLCLDNHKADGIFRIYLDEIGHKDGPALNRMNVPYEFYGGDGANSVGEQMDKWLEKNADVGVIRKMANSPLFNKFRPFPLGMINDDKTGKVFYGRRTPTRPNTQQGLTASMLRCKEVDLTQGSKPTLSDNPYRSGYAPQLLGKAVYNCIKGVYPTFNEVLTNLKNPAIDNSSAAFHREFALLRGPLDTLFLAYKDDVIGMMPNGDTSSLVISRKFKHCKEVVDELAIFSNITVQS